MDDELTSSACTESDRRARELEREWWRIRYVIQRDGDAEGIEWVRRTREIYRDISVDMLRHMSDRPLTLRRFPDGIAGDGFYQHRAADHFPDWLGRVEVETADGAATLVTCDDVASLVFLANQACISLHCWLARRDRLRHPDRLVIDLDPPADDFETVVHAARATRDLLETVGLVPFVQTTGSNGAHVVVPIVRRHGFDDARAFATDLARLLAAREDPWKGMGRHARTLGQPWRRLRAILDEAGIESEHR